MTLATPLVVDDAARLEDEIIERGFRLERVILPDGREDYEYIPLTLEEYLHPKEGYHLPNNTFHDQTILDLVDMLTRRYLSVPTVEVFSDLSFVWGHPTLKRHCYFDYSEAEA